MNMFCGTRPCVASMIARPMRSPPAPTPEWVTISTCFVGTHPSVSAALPEAAGAACCADGAVSAFPPAPQAARFRIIVRQSTTLNSFFI